MYFKLKNSLTSFHETRQIARKSTVWISRSVDNLVYLHFLQIYTKIVSQLHLGTIVSNPTKEQFDMFIYDLVNTFINIQIFNPFPANKLMDLFFDLSTF